MDLTQIIMGSVLTLWLSSQEYRIRYMREKLEEKTTREEVKELIDLKKEAIKIYQAELKEDITRVENKMDKLIEYIHRKV